MKKMINYHTHTYRCGHALGNEYEMVEAALHEGYQELGMSCHIALPHYSSFTDFYSFITGIKIMYRCSLKKWP